MTKSTPFRDGRGKATVQWDSYDPLASNTVKIRVLFLGEIMGLLTIKKGKNCTHRNERDQSCHDSLGNLYRRDIAGELNWQLMKYLFEPAFYYYFFLFGFLFHQEELQPLDPSPSGFKMVINYDVSEDVSNWRIELMFSKAINIGRFNIDKAFVEPHSEQADSVCLRPRQHNKVLGSGEKLRLEFVCEYGEHGKDQEVPTGNFKFLPDATECDGGASTSGEFSLNKTATYLYFE